MTRTMLQKLAMTAILLGGETDATGCDSFVYQERREL